LTILQLTIGIWLVTTLFSVYLVGMSELAASAPTFGASYAQLRLIQVERQPNRTIYKPVATMTNRDLGALVDESEAIEAAFFYQPAFSALLYHVDRPYRVRTLARVSASFAEAVQLELVEGEFFTPLDEEQSSNVVLLSKTIADYLFPNQSALGKTVSMPKRTGAVEKFQVIGVYEGLASGAKGLLDETFVITPRVASSLGEGEYDLFIQANQDQLPAAISDARIVLSSHLQDGVEMQVTTLEEQLQRQAAQLNNLSAFLAIFAFIALLVSAIGVFCILLVSVLERTREIGLRMALGASRRSVVKDILGESLLYTVLGALLGIPVAASSFKPMGMPFITELLSLAQEGTWHFPWRAGFYALLLASAATLLISLYPAHKGSKIPPIEALREL
jgi:putative ABC transport system permease protein